VALLVHHHGSGDLSVVILQALLRKLLLYHNMLSNNIIRKPGILPPIHLSLNVNTIIRGNLPYHLTMMLQLH